MIEIIADNESAISFLQDVQPDWIETLPVMASHAHPQKELGAISQGIKYFPEKRMGVMARYLGVDFPEDDRGWLILVHRDVSQEFFADLLNDLKKRSRL